jgi:hypothetical protein
MNPDRQIARLKGEIKDQIAYHEKMRALHHEKAALHNDRLIQLQIGSRRP